MEVKKLLDIDLDDTSEDVKLSLLIKMASSWIEQWCGREFEVKSRTEFYSGTGTMELRLRNRPVFTTPNPAVRIDEEGWFNAEGDRFDSTTALTWGDDFALVLDDRDTVSSRSGILVRRRNFWPKPSVRQRGYLSPFIGKGYGNIRIQYTAGFGVDTLPEDIRLAANFLVARLAYTFPLGVELSSESYLDRSISAVTSEKNKLLALVSPLLMQHRNWHW